MIFVTLGTQKFQFNRLLKHIDEMVKNEEINDVFAQIGNSTYIPQNYKYQKFLDKNEMENMIYDAELVLTHAGVGTIINSINKGKPTIVIPRLAQYGEHVDNHQFQIAESFSNKNLVISNGENINDLSINIKKSKDFKFEKYISSNLKIQSLILDFINQEENKK